MTEIGLDHGWIRGDLPRCASGDDLAVAEYSEPLTHVHDQIHVVFDDDDGHASTADLANHRFQALLLGRVEARSGLIQEEDRRLRGEGPGYLESPLAAISQVHSEFVRDLMQVEVLE